MLALYSYVSTLLMLFITIAIVQFCDIFLVTKTFTINFIMRLTEKPGLTRETFLAVRQSCLAIAECASYLLEQRKFCFVLLGQLQSDSLESRFGWFRQMSGGNYYVSVKQVVNSDRKIRAICLLRYSSFTVADIDNAISERTDQISDKDSSLQDALISNLIITADPSESDLNILYYVAGAMSRSVLHCNHCNSCKDVITDDKPLQPLEADASVSSTFLDEINRGGLTRPSEYAFNLTVSCWRVYETLKANKDSMSLLLQANCLRDVFVRVVEQCVVDDEPLVAENYCMKNHDVKTLLVHRFVNCICKNLVKELSSDRDSRVAGNKRKIGKLSGNS